MSSSLPSASAIALSSLSAAVWIASVSVGASWVTAIGLMPPMRASIVHRLSRSPSLRLLRSLRWTSTRVMRPWKRSSLPSTTPCTRSVRSSPPELTNTCIRPPSNESAGGAQLTSTGCKSPAALAARPYTVTAGEGAAFARYAMTKYTQGLCRSNRGRGGGYEPGNEAVIEESPLPGAEIAGQLDRSVADAQQSADLVARGFPNTPHLAVAALVEHDPIGGIARRGLTRERVLFDDPIEGGGAVFQRDPAQELLDRVAGRPAMDPHQVFALDAARGMHEAVSEIAVGGEEEQARGVDIQP